jgi:hypothetical protein
VAKAAAQPVVKVAKAVAVSRNLAADKPKVRVVAKAADQPVVKAVAELVAAKVVAALVVAKVAEQLVARVVRVSPSNP